MSSGLRVRDQWEKEHSESPPAPLDGQAQLARLKQTTLKAMTKLEMAHGIVGVKPETSAGLPSQGMQDEFVPEKRLTPNQMDWRDIDNRPFSSYGLPQQPPHPPPQQHFFYPAAHASPSATPQPLFRHRTKTLPGSGDNRGTNVAFEPALDLLDRTFRMKLRDTDDIDWEAIIKRGNRRLEQRMALA